MSARFTGPPPLPDRAHRMDHESAGQIERRSDLGIAGGAVTDALARLGELRVLHAGSFWTRRGAVGTRGQQPSDPMPGVPEKDEL